MEVLKNIGLVLLGIIVAIAVYCVIVGIGCAINGVTFGQQIVNWFGPKEVTETVETTGMILHSLGM